MDNDKNKAKAFCFSRVDTDRGVIIPDWAETIPDRDDVFVKYGPANTFPSELRDLSRQSVSASSVINGTCEYFKGLNYEFNITQPSLSEESFNRDGETAKDVIDAAVRDYLTFGGFALHAIYNRLGELAEVYCIPLEFLRTNESRSRFWFSKKWSKYSTKSIEYIALEDRKEEPSAIYYYSNSGRLQTYPISVFTPVLYDMYSEGVSGKYVAKTLDSGISARYVISLPNAQNLTDEQKSDIEKGIKAKFTGLENAGEFMLYFNNGSEGLEVEKIDSDDTGQTFNTISDSASLRIYKSLHATPALFGDPSHSSGFNSNEYDEALKLFKKMTLKPLAEVIERGFNAVLGKNSIKITVE